MDRVLVVDADRQFVEYVAPAVARRALKDGHARVFRKRPFSIQLPPGATKCPTPHTRKAKPMRTTITNFTELFREEQDIYVKKLVPGQVSIGFRVGPSGESDSYCVKSGDPECLTDRIPFEAVKHSSDLRTLANPRRVKNGFKPPAIAVMTYDEAVKHFEKKAKRRGLWTTDENGNKVPDVAAAQAPRIVATDEHTPRTKITPSKQKEEPEGLKQLGKEGKIKIVNPINSRVQQMLHELNLAEDENERMLADDLIEEFEAMGDELNRATLKHISQDGYYATVKRWADARIDELDGDDEE